MIDQTPETDVLSPVPALRYALFLSYQGKVVKSIHTKKWGRVLWLINNKTFDKAHVIVKYFDTGMINEGVYYNIDNLKIALSAFREPELLEYVG